MKKKLLTVLLAVVMVFGVFGLTACGAGKNPDDDYNYYSSVYSSLKDETDIRISSLTYFALERLFTTNGIFLVYIGNHMDDKANENMKVINDLAKEYDVQVYHFDPVLDGGILSKKPGGSTMDLRDSQEDLAAVSTAMADMQLFMLQFTNQSAVPVGFMAVTGAAITYTIPTEAKDGDSAVANYNGVVTKRATDNAEYESVIQAVAQKKPSYAKPVNHDGGDAAVKTDINSNAYDASNLSTFNMFNDYRLHMAGDFDAGIDAYTEESDSIFVTATYHAFIDLLTNNKGYFAVFFGGAWCGNTQAIAFLTNQVARDYGISKIYMYDPRWDDGIKLDIATVVGEGDDQTISFLKNLSIPFYGMNSRAADNTAHKVLMLGDTTDKTGTFTADNPYLVQYEDPQYLTYNNHGTSSHIINYTYEVASGTKSVNELDYYHATGAQQTSKFIRTVYTNPNDKNAKPVPTYKLVANDYGSEVKEADKIDKPGYEQKVIELTGKRFNAADAENYNQNYAYLLDNYLPTYVSYWNYGSALSIDGKTYSQMAVPNIMLFDGSAEKQGDKLVGYAEAEYKYDFTGIEGSAQREQWIAAVKELFDKNPYASYVPEIAVDVATTENSGSESSSSSSSSGSAAASSGDAC